MPAKEKETLGGKAKETKTILTLNVRKSTKENGRKEEGRICY